MSDRNSQSGDWTIRIQVAALMPEEAHRSLAWQMHDAAINWAAAVGQELVGGFHFPKTAAAHTLSAHDYALCTALGMPPIPEERVLELIAHLQELVCQHGCDLTATYALQGSAENGN